MMLAEKFDGMTCGSRRHRRAVGRESEGSGFTLIELLVVVAIIALLMAVLVPSLSRAKEQAKAVKCGANLRDIGQIVQIYANDHDGRGPGGSEGHNGNFGYSASWADILNREVLGRGMWGVNSSPDQGPNDYSIQAGHSWNPSTRTLSCPNFVPLVDSSGNPVYNRPWGYNKDANGGLDAGAPYYGFYGVPARDPGPFTIEGTTYSYDPGTYFLGAKLNRFRTDEYLIREFDHSDDVTDDGTSGHNTPTLGNGSVVLGGTPPYSGAGAEVSFRHPYYKRANFLSFDDHVVSLTPKDDVYSTRTVGMPKSP